MPNATDAASLAAKPSAWRQFPLALLRIVVGWHFLYEGIYKLFDPGWPAKLEAYLKGTGDHTAGFLANFFEWLAADPARLDLVGQLNVWGLIAIGACLVLGLVTRLAALAGVVLLALYYVAYPPLFGAAPAGAPLEGNYLIVNKTLVELLAMGVVLIWPAKMFGLDGILYLTVRGVFRAIFSRKRTRSLAREKYKQPAGAKAPEPGPAPVPPRYSRRVWLTGLTGVPVAGALAAAVVKKYKWESFEEMQLAARLAAEGKRPDEGEPGDEVEADAVTQPSIKSREWAKVEDLKGKKVPTAKIGDVVLSRMILGGNLIGGWAHARDLIYVSDLVKAYHHDQKVFETFQLAEACGVNTILTNPVLCRVIGDYWKKCGGKIQFISDCGGSDVLNMIQQSIDGGACACYVQGGTADSLVAKGDFDTIEKALELIRKNKIPAGIGGHKLATVTACVEKGFKPDFWMKTLHHTNYWSAKPAEQNDNIWCEQPEETIAYMKERKEPWIAFKTLAAGAIRPKEGFQYAFQNGADFICVGMYDFQLVEDVKIALDVLGQLDDGKLQRQRAWYA